MPSNLHQLLLELFRNHSKSAADLLLGIDVPVPEYDEVRTESSDLSDVKPAEYRADLVLLLARAAQNVLGIIVEVQLGRDDDKPYSWPAYIANLHARHRCPVCLLVITLDASVARWAHRPIKLGPGTRCRPWVIGPSNAPVVAEPRQAKENVELAVLSAIEHVQNPDAELAARIVFAALDALDGIDAERSRLYFDLIKSYAPEAVEATMNSLGFEYQSDFARRYYGQGKTEGKAEGLIAGRLEGRVEIILKMLAGRFGPLPDTIQTSVRGANDIELDALAERMLTAQFLEQALGSLLI